MDNVAIPLLQTLWFAAESFFAARVALENATANSAKIKEAAIAALSQDSAIVEQAQKAQSAIMEIIGDLPDKVFAILEYLGRQDGGFLTVIDANGEAGINSYASAEQKTVYGSKEKLRADMKAARERFETYRPVVLDLVSGGVIPADVFPEGIPELPKLSAGGRPPGSTKVKGFTYSFTVNGEKHPETRLSTFLQATTRKCGGSNVTGALSVGEFTELLKAQNPGVSEWSQAETWSVTVKDGLVIGFVRQEIPAEPNADTSNASA